MVKGIIGPPFRPNLGLEACTKLNKDDPPKIKIGHLWLKIDNNLFQRPTKHEYNYSKILNDY